MLGVEFGGEINSGLTKGAACGDCYAAHMLGPALGRSLTG